MTIIKWEICPVCKGTGILPFSFKHWYIGRGCRLCDGKGKYVSEEIIDDILRKIKEME